MKNLKRALSFALASVMLVGMMVVGAGAADFTDADEIVNDEAVNTLVALNVINGKGDGSYFDPTGIVTRAEMAKMITVALNGGKEPVIGTKTEPTYTDIKGTWAEAYIEYCSNLGIIAGRGDGSFDPTGTVTGTEAAKMMLVAMGWDATIFEFTGASWAINVNTEANKVDLYDELETIDPSAGLTRDNAAQLIYNGILADTMQKSPSMEITGGEITWQYYLTNESLFESKFGGQIWIGTMTGNDKTVSTLDDGEIQIVGGDEDVASEKRTTKANFPSDLSIDNIGEEVKVLFKDGKAGKTNQPDKKDTIYGVFNTGAVDVITATMGDMKDNKEAKAKINIGGTKYEVADTVTVITNYVGSGTEYTGTQLKGDADNNSKLTADLKNQNGNTIKAVCDAETGKIVTIYVTESKIATVTAKNAEKVTMNNGVGTIKIADNEVYADIAKDDVVVVTTLYSAKATDDEAYTIVEKAEVVTGEVTGYKETEKVTVDGTTYKIYNKTATMHTAGIDDAVKAFDDKSIGETYDLYMVKGYVAAAAQVSESANNYSMVIAKNGGSAGNTFSPLKLQVIDATGTKSIIVVNDDSALTKAEQYTIGDIITYTGDASDAKVTVKVAKTKGGYTYNEKTKAVDGKVTTSDAVLFAEVSSAKLGDESGTKYKAYSIRSLDGLTVDAYVTNDDGKVVAVVADLATTPAGATDTTVYGIVTAYNGKVEIDDDYYWSYTVASNEDTYTLYLDAKALAAGKLVSFEPAADETYDAKLDITVITTEAVYVDEYNEADETLTYFTAITGDAGGYVGDASSKNTLALDEDCVIVYVDQDDQVAGAEIGVNPFDSVTGYKNAVIVTEKDGSETVIVAIFVETSNECDIIEAAK